jgi:hypothetical protein
MKFLEIWDNFFFHPDVDPKSSSFLSGVLPNPGRKMQNPLQKCKTLYKNAKPSTKIQNPLRYVKTVFQNTRKLSRID